MKKIKTFESKLLDDILDKIYTSGIDSLTSLEKEYLDKFSKGHDTKDIEKEINKKEYEGEIGPFEAKIVLTDIEHISGYQTPTFGDHDRWYGSIYIGDVEYKGFIGFKGTDYLYSYFGDIYDDLEGFYYEIDTFCENALYSILEEIKNK